MKIVIAGGSGLVGKYATKFFEKKGYDVSVLSRKPFAPREVFWDGESVGDWKETLEGADVVINLSGKSVNCRYTESNKQEIMASRINSTRAIGEAISSCNNPPKVWLQMSTATIYSHRFDKANDEDSGEIGGGSGSPAKWKFSIEVAKAWEAEAEKHKSEATRQVLMRTAIVMTPNLESPFGKLYTLARVGLGGNIAGGQQYMSWIHIDDFCRAIDHLIAIESLSGVVNLASPNPLTFGNFMRILRITVGVPVGLSASKWMIELGTRVLGTESELVLKSRRVVSNRLEDSGFQFVFPNWESAAENLCDNFRATSP